MDNVKTKIPTITIDYSEQQKIYEQEHCKNCINNTYCKQQGGYEYIPLQIKHSNQIIQLYCPDYFSK